MKVYPSPYGRYRQCDFQREGSKKSGLGIRSLSKRFVTGKGNMLAEAEISKIKYLRLILSIYFVVMKIFTVYLGIAAL